MTTEELSFPAGYRYRGPHYNEEIQQWVIHHEMGVHFGNTAEEAKQRALAVVDLAMHRK